MLSGLILRRIFDRNQEQFTNAVPETIPTIAVVEEAQSVLSDQAAASEPYIAWIKEGRKYDLGALLITQQPGSIPLDILSQGDNWFVFHLLSSTDLVNLKKANAHFSDDLLSSLLNEPIPGQGVFWSSVAGKPYPVSLRVLDFNAAYPVRDQTYNMAPGNTYAMQLRSEFPTQTRQEERQPVTQATAPALFGEEQPPNDEPDILESIDAAAIEKLRQEQALIFKIESTDGVAWGAVKAFFNANLPQNLDDRDTLAYQLVKKAMDQLYGEQGTGWQTFKSGSGSTYVRRIRS